jgi:hypothetical protein
MQQPREYQYRITPGNDELTGHALMFAARDYAEQVGLLGGFGEHVHLKMKKRVYTVADKLATLWASVVVGCDHTVEINTKLGGHEQALAKAFGLERFPEQSQINRLLRACRPETVTQVQHLHLDLLAAHSQARDRANWRRLATGERVLVADLDQRGLVVSGTTYELAESGHFGRKRGRRGYQLSTLFLGGAIGELVDEYLDGARTPAAARIDDLLASLKRVCKRLGIKRSEVVIRGDAQYGTPYIIAKIETYRFGYFFKGISPAHARTLVRDVGEQTVFECVQTSGAGAQHWLADLGECTHTGRRQDGTRPAIEARTLAGVWVQWVRPRGTRPGPSVRARREALGQARCRQITHECFVTSLSAAQLALGDSLAFYNERQTIERYFADEQNALGARHVRTHYHAGAAVFQWVVAIANNVLRWMRRRVWHDTPLEGVGLKRLIKHYFQIPGRVVLTGATRVIEVAATHWLVPHLVAWLVTTSSAAKRLPSHDLLPPHLL